MRKLDITSHESRRARVRSLIQLGSLLERAGLLETFGITLGKDLQKDPLMKNQIAALYKGLLELNALANSEAIHLPTWEIQGLEEFTKLKRNQSR